MTIAPPTWNSLPQAASGEAQVGRPLVEQELDALARELAAGGAGRGSAHRRRSGEVELHLVLGEQRLQPGRFASGLARRVDTRREDGHPQMLFSNHIRGKRATVNFDEGPELEMLRDAVRGVADGFGHEYFAECTRTDTRTDALWQAVADLGFLAVHLPEAYGGGGGGITELTVVCEELAAAGCPLLLILVSAAICAELVAKFGTDEQCRTWLPPLATGTKMAFAITEPGAGSNSHHLTTTATRDGDATACAAKTFISGVDESAAILVVAPGTRRRRSRAALIVHRRRRCTGPHAHDHPRRDPRAGEAVHAVLRRRAGRRRPASGEEDEGLRQVFVGLNPERIMSAAICNGIGRYALDRAAACARSRGVGRAHRAASRHRAPARRGEDRRRARG